MVWRWNLLMAFVPDIAAIIQEARGFLVEAAASVEGRGIMKAPRAFLHVALGGKQGSQALRTLRIGFKIEQGKG